MSGKNHYPKITRNRLIGLAVGAVCLAIVSIFQPDLVMTIVKAVVGE